ncbi:MAG: transposase [Lachnospiraceae bacterium]
MPTTRRKESSTGFYHIIVKGINREKIFYQQREKLYFKSIISKHLKKYKAEIYSYCIMSTHAHFIIRAEIQILSLFMAAILAEYALYYNFKHHRNGHVFQNRFISECIENDRYLWTCLRYIHMNPVKAGIIKKPERYKYSSMSEYLTETPDLLHEKAIDLYKAIFSKVEDFIEFHGERNIEMFGDIPDEKEMQYEEMALLMAKNMFQEYQLTVINQVFEEKKIRQEYIDNLKEILKISVKKAKKLCDITMNHVENE